MNDKPPSVEPRSFTIAFDGLSKELITPVRLSQAFDPRKKPDPPLSAKQFYGLWDTGASGTCISDKVVDECGLKPIGMVKTLTAGGERLSSVYFVNVLLPNGVGIANLRVTGGDLIGHFDALIGMDIISRGDLAITNQGGKSMMSFRIPSITHIDFVDPANRTGGFELTKKDGKLIQSPVKATPQKKSNKKVGRNQPCPCGSGKKYKKCCGK